jgi:hypothetical protein
MPHHLATLDALLHHADFANTRHIGIDGHGRMFWFAGDLEDPDCRARMLREPPFNIFDMSFGGHTLSAYRRLSIGWSPPPPPPSADPSVRAVQCPADLFLWRQFLAEAWCRVRSGASPTGVCTHTHLRPDMTDREPRG